MCGDAVVLSKAALRLTPEILQAADMRVRRGAARTPVDPVVANAERVKCLVDIRPVRIDHRAGIEPVTQDGKQRIASPVAQDNGLDAPAAL